MLLLSRRFFPFFLAQFGGAFNDNLFKNALLVYLTLTVSSSRELSLYSNLAMALFIAPMFLFSAWSGLIADRFEKHGLIVKIKWLEVAIMALGVVSFISEQVWLMLLVLCLLGLQSTFFGPVKYGILPERLREEELMLGNGLVEAGTFLAILGGTLLGAYLVSLAAMQWLLFATMCLTAGLGLLAAWFIPKGEQNPKGARLPPFQPWRQTRELLKETAKEKIILQSILAISWFWLLGGALLTQIPQYSRDVLGGDPSVTTYLLVLFSLGIGIGSLAANVLSRGRIEAGLVPFGGFLLALGLAGVIAIDPTTPENLYTFTEFFHHGAFYAASVSFFCLAFAGGLYVVPLYALIQARAEKGRKSQTIAANNILNALFLVIISVVSLLILSVIGWSFQTLFTLLLIAHLLVCAYIFTIVPEFIFRLIVIMICTLMYRLKVRGRDNIPQEGAAFVICNHVTYLDPLILMAASRRPIRFVMYHKIFHVPVLRWLFKTARAIPVAPRHECEKTYQQALESVHEALQNGELIGIFPEGKITPDGSLQPFREGIERMLARDPVPIIPMALGNLWGCFFSRHHGLFRGLPRKWMARIPLTIGAPLPAHSTAAEMQQHVAELLREQENAAAKP